jgi:RNA polymerase sigma factor for flagellar operon FliA
MATLPVPTAQALWQRYHQRADLPTENALVEQYLPLVASILGRLAMTLPEHVSHDDLYSAGLVGLLQALRNYDPTCGSSFETYARVRVRGAMLDELRHMDWVPRSIHEKARKIQDVMARLEQKLGRTPTEAQMAQASGRRHLSAWIPRMAPRTVTRTACMRRLRIRRSLIRWNRFRSGNSNRSFWNA